MNALANYPQKRFEWCRLTKKGKIYFVIAILLTGVLHGASFLDIFSWREITCAVQYLGFMLFTFLVFVHENRKQALWTAFGFGVVNNLVSFIWLWGALYQFGHLGVIGSSLILLLFSIVLSLYFVFAVFLVFLASRYSNHIKILGNLRFVFLWAASYTIMVYIRSIFLTGFTWNDLAYVYADGFIYSLVPIVGGLGLDFLIVFLATIFMMFLINRLHYIKTGVFLLLVVVFSFLLLYVSWTVPSGDQVVVRLIQTNTPQSMKFDERQIETNLEQLERLIKQQSELGQLDLIVAPETVIPNLPMNIKTEFWYRILNHIKANDYVLLLGMPIFEKNEQGTYNFYNAVVALDKDTDLTTLLYNPTQLPHYSKQHLVPFGEYTPSVLKWLGQYVPVLPLDSFSSGGEQQPFFEVKGQKIATNICYEDGFSPLFQNMVNERNARGSANIFLNVSNLAWFWGHSALLQHQYISMVRATEMGRPTLRSSNTGATAFINEIGQPLDVLPYNTRGVLDVVVQGVEGQTPFSYVGDRGIAALALLIYLATMCPWTRRR
ncbi:MAG: apolipoprotein N-acyltransferase [Alcaligenaceae bacterium]|nr:apolipoprotein N-acyltransferase [Alcaligenaceae bacterium]